MMFDYKNTYIRYKSEFNEEDTPNSEIESIKKLCNKYNKGSFFGSRTHCKIASYIIENNFNNLTEVFDYIYRQLENLDIDPQGDFAYLVIAVIEVENKVSEFSDLYVKVTGKQIEEKEMHSPSPLHSENEKSLAEIMLYFKLVSEWLPVKNSSNVMLSLSLYFLLNKPESLQLNQLYDPKIFSSSQVSPNISEETQEDMINIDIIELD